MSYKTLNGLESEWSEVFPPKEKIQDIFTAHPLIYNCLHYADYDGHGREVSRSIKRAIEWGGRNINAIQLDMIWPDPFHISHGVQLSGKKVDVILQVGKKAMEEVENNPLKLLAKLWSYEGVIDGVLLDLSMGRGKEMDPALFRSLIKWIKGGMPKLHIAVAGGLGPGTVGKLLRPIFAHHDVSVDAQGRLRSSGNAKDPIDWDMAEQYVREVLELRQDINYYFDSGMGPPPGWEEAQWRW